MTSRELKKKKTLNYNTKTKTTTTANHKTENGLAYWNN